MRRKIRLAAMVVVVGLLMGCEWEGSDSDSSWSDRFNWFVVAGSYQGSDGDAVVNVPGEGTGGGGGTDPDTIPVVNEPDGTLGALQTDASGNTDHVPIEPGTFTVVMKTLSGAGGSFVDDGSGNLTGNFNLAGPDSPFDNEGIGDIVYETGKWNLSLESPGFLGDAAITLNYSYEDVGVVLVDEAEDDEDVTAGGAIYGLVVVQQGDLLTITDDRGGRYTGRLTGASTTSGDVDGMSDGEVIAQFEVSGTAGNGTTSVTIVGTFSAYLTVSADGGARALASRSMRGTWIQNDGVTADVYGVSGNSTEDLL